MYPDAAYTIAKQRGSMLVIAIFILVVMSLLVGALSRLLQNSSEAVVVEVLGTRAFYAAQSGMELELLRLFPLDASPAQCISVDPRTDANVSYSFLQVDGLNQCRVWVDCTESASAENASIRHYRLVSIGSCEAGEVKTSRVIEMEVWQ